MRRQSALFPLPCRLILLLHLLITIGHVAQAYLETFPMCNWQVQVALRTPAGPSSPLLRSRHCSGRPVA